MIIKICINIFINNIIYISIHKALVNTSFMNLSYLCFSKLAFVISKPSEETAVSSSKRS